MNHLLARTAAALALFALAAPPAAAQTPPADVRLPLADYEALVKAARDRGGPQPTWATGRVRATLPGADDAFVLVQLSAQLSLVGEGTAEVLLLPGHVVLEDARVDGVAATLALRGGGHVALVDAASRRRYEVSLTYRVPVSPGSDGGRVALVPMPPLPGANLTVATGGAGPVEVWPVGNVTGAGNDVVVNLPATHAAVLRWGVAPSHVRRVDYQLAVDPGSDGAAIEGRYEVVIDAPRAVVRLAPDTVALTDVTENGRPLATRVNGGWHEAVVTGAGRHLVVASFRTGIDRSQGQPEVNLTLSRAPITRVEARIPGKRAVTFDPAVPVSLETQGEGDAAVTLASGFLPPTEALTISWTEPRTAPERVVSSNAETYQLVRIEEGVIRSKVEVRYEIIRGSLKELPIELPDDAGVVLYRVSGDGIEDWRTFAATETEPRQARIFLGAEREGTYVLNLELEQVVPTEIGAPLRVPLVRPLGVTRERGAVALFDGERVGFGPAETDNGRAGEDALPVEIRQGLGGDIVTQAFKHIGAPAAIRSRVQEAKERAFSFDARIESLYVFQQNALEVRSIVAIDVKSGRTDEIVLSLPRGVEITGEVNAPSLKSAEWADDDAEDAPRRRYRVQLTQAIAGHFTIELVMSQTVASDVTELAAPDVLIEAAKVQKGVIGVAVEGMLEVSQRAATGLTKLDVAQLPRSITLQTKREVELGYAYSFAEAEGAPALTLGLKRHQTVETLTAAIRRMAVETTVFEEGEIVSRATFEVENKDENFLRLIVPEGARVLGASVGGEGAEPIADDATTLKIRIPKQRRVTVELTYLVKREALGFLPALELVAPRPVVFVNDLQWLVRLPSKFTIYSADSTLRDGDPSEWRAPERPDGGVDIAITSSEDTQARLFRLDVLDAAAEERAPTVTMSLVATPGTWLGVLLFVAGLALLAFAGWRRARRPGGAGLVALVIAGGLVLLVVKALGWGLGGGEAVVALLVVGVAVFFGWSARRHEEALG